ncbi:7871_t:CDS:2 [Funneliformis caledonium]|uniref:7871_t:CDS:1 n=1 Tax=Funneliformis caledonium TaxID=1117310 RepID=A0A9N9AHV9_9GLOM|nr:7871_t:CDS:2 [Funneliformis caledonium]
MINNDSQLNKKVVTRTYQSSIDDDSIIVGAGFRGTHAHKRARVLSYQAIWYSRSPEREYYRIKSYSIFFFTEEFDDSDVSFSGY